MEIACKDRIGLGVDMGFDINWSPSPTNSIQTHPLYIKYSNQTFAALAPLAVGIKQDLDGVLASKENVYIIAYLSWLLRVVALV